MYRVLIVEDQTAQSQALCQLLEAYPENFDITVRGDLVGAREQIVANRFDLFFLDLRLDESDASNSDGLLLSHEIRRLPGNEYVPIIFLTAVPEKIQEALNEVGCFRYILKPYHSADIAKCLDSLLHSPLVSIPSLSFHNFWGGTLHIPENLIFYCCPGNGRRIEIHTADGFYESIDFTLEALEQRLHHNFIRCHRRFLVNRMHIADYDRSRHTIKVNEEILPVGRRYRKKLDDFWRITHDGIS